MGGIGGRDRGENAPTSGGDGEAHRVELAVVAVLVDDPRIPVPHPADPVIERCPDGDDRVRGTGEGGQGGIGGDGRGPYSCPDLESVSPHRRCEGERREPRL